MRFENLNEDVVKEISKGEPEWFVNERLVSLKMFNEAEDDSFNYGMTMKTEVDNIKVNNFISKFNLAILNNDNRVVIKDLKESFNEYENFIKNFFMREIKSKMDFLHKALVQNFLLIYIPKDIEVTNEIVLEYEFMENNSFDHLLIIADDNSKVNIIEILEEGKGIFRSGFVEIYARNNSKVNFFSFQNLNKNVNNFSTKKAVVGNNAECNFYSFDFGSILNHSQIFSRLIDDGATSKINGAYFSNEKQHFNLSYNSIHESGNTFSNILTKGVLDDYSNSIYRGLIKIKSNAQNSNGYQKEDVLILNDNAKADSIPNLEIENNEVKCSHGASIGHIDRDKLFYLMSKGISKEMCVEIIVKGFFSEIISDVKDEFLRENIIISISNKIKNEY